MQILKKKLNAWTFIALTAILSIAISIVYQLITPDEVLWNDFMDQRQEYFLRILKDELKRSPCPISGLEEFADAFCEEIVGAKGLNYRTGKRLPVRIEQAQSIIKMGEKLAKEGCDHIVLWYGLQATANYLPREERSCRKGYAEAGWKLHEANQGCHPILAYELARSLSYSDKSSRKEWKAKQLRYFPKVMHSNHFQPSEMRVVSRWLCRAITSDFLGTVPKPGDVVLEDPSVPVYFQQLAKGTAVVADSWNLRRLYKQSGLTEYGRQSLLKEMNTAHSFLVRAWEMHPEIPYAAEDMIMVSSHDGSDEVQLWFDRSVEAQADYSFAYRRYITALTTRSEVNTSDLLCIAQKWVDGGRFDTSIPWQSARLLVKMYESLGYAEDPLIDPQVSEIIRKLHKGYSQACKWEPDEHAAIGTYLAFLASLASDSKLAHEIFMQQNYAFNDRYLKAHFREPSKDFVWRAWFYGSHKNSQIHKAELFAETGQYAEAEKTYRRLMETEGIPAQALDRLLIETDLLTLQRTSRTEE